MLPSSDAPSPSSPAAWPRQDVVIVAAALLVALAARLAMVKLTPGMSFGDIEEYVGGAERLLAHQALPMRNKMSFIRAPGYSLFIALVWLVTGVRTVGAVKVAQCFVATGTCWYVYRLARELGCGRLGATIAIFAAALYPYLVYQAATPATEAIFAFFATAGLFHLAVALRQDSPPIVRLVAAGILLAVGNLVRPNLSTILPLVALLIIIRFRRRPREIVRIGTALVLSVGLTTLPWIVSVARNGHGVMWVTDGAGIWYWLGHNDTAERLYCGRADAAERKRIITELPFDMSVFYGAAAAPEGKQPSVFWKSGLDWDRAHPSKLPCLMLGKAELYLRPFVEPSVYPLSRVIISLAALPVMILGVIGLWLARRRNDVLVWLIAINIFAGTLTAALFSTEIRYRIPVVDVPLMASMGVTIEWLRAKIRLFRRSPS